MHSRLSLPFNRWQCDLHLILKASTVRPPNMDESRITACNFSDSRCLTVSLFIYFFYPQKLLCAQFCLKACSTNTPESSTLQPPVIPVQQHSEIRTSLSPSDILPDSLGSCTVPAAFSTLFLILNGWATYEKDLPSSIEAYCVDYAFNNSNRNRFIGLFVCFRLHLCLQNGFWLKRC